MSEKHIPLLALFDPRIKLALLLFYSVAFFVPSDPVSYLFLFIPLLPIGIATCGTKNFFSIFKIILPIIILTAILTPLFFKGGEVIAAIGSFVWLTSEGLAETSGIIIRFFGITTLFYLYFKTTEADDFILTLRFFGLPYRFSLIITIAVRYIPFLLKTYRNTEAAHKLRKTEGTPSAGRWDFPKRFAAMLPVLSAVLIQAIKNISVLAMALESRGAGRKNKVSVYSKLTIRYPLKIQILLSFATVVVIIMILSIYPGE